MDSVRVNGYFRAGRGAFVVVEVQAPLLRMLGIPSLLGRDILDRYRLVYDRPINEVFLTDER